jgi:hypothetical protein
MIIECLVTKHLSTSEQSEMGTARTGMCVHSHVTEVGEMMEWQHVTTVSVIGSWNWLPFAKNIRILFSDDALSKIRLY